MAGGVALNCVANGRVIRETPMKELWVQPAAGDAGGAVGVAHYLYNTLEKQPRARAWTHAYLGPQFADAEIAQYLDGAGAKYETARRAELLERTARLLSEKNVVGWFQGRMEFGPRALGGRSILADPRDPKMRDTLNMKIKFREGFRPFAPSVLAGQGLGVVRDRLRQPLHAAGGPGARGQADDPLGHPRRQLGAPADGDPRGGAALLRPDRASSSSITGVPIIINTSFNVRGEPIVCTPHDAYLCFMRTNMDHLVLGHHLLDKKEQPPLREDVDWRTLYELD